MERVRFAGPGYQATRNYFEEVSLPISLPVLQRRPSVMAHSSPVTEFQLQRCDAKIRGLPKTQRVGRISLVWKSRVNATIMGRLVLWDTYDFFNQTCATDRLAIGLFLGIAVEPRPLLFPGSKVTILIRAHRLTTHCSCLHFY